MDKPDLDREDGAFLMLSSWMITAIAAGAVLCLLLRETDYLTWAAIAVGAAFGVAYCTLPERESVSIGVTGGGILALGVVLQDANWWTGLWNWAGLACLGSAASLVIYGGWPMPKLIGRWLRNVWVAWRKAGEVADALAKRTAR